MARADRNMAAKGGDKDFKTQDVRGVREERGIVIGIVKVNSHPARMGNLSVFIPQFGNTGTTSGKRLEDDPSQWRQVRYCSPFYSRTEVSTATGQPNNSISVKNTAGMIYPCPDIGTRVLCFFPEGRNAEGFWFACAPDTYMMQSLPEPSMTSNYDATSQRVRHTRAPAGEFNDLENDVTKIKNFLQPKRALDTDSLNQLVAQGLDQDEIRGLTTSSYMRETPSEVFGITTKGRRVDQRGRDISTRTDILEALKQGTDLRPDQQDVLIKPIARKHGHAFVMDDGDLEGNSNLVRIRSSHGHQILLHDTEDLIYISNGSGSAWIQMDRAGQIDLYSSVNVNVRSRNINFHADDSIKFHAKRTIQMVAEQNAHIEGGTMVNLYSDQGSAYMFGGKGIQIKGAGTVNVESSSGFNLKASGDMKIQASCLALQGSAAGAQKQNKAVLKDLTDTGRDATGFWSANTQVKTSVDRAPSHEPYSEHKVTTQPSIYTAVETEPVAGTENQPQFPANPPATKDTGIQQVRNQPNPERVSATSIAKQPNLSVSMGKLDSDSVRAVGAAVTEKLGTDFNYAAVDAVTGAVGKYAANVDVLKKAGFVRPEIFFNGQLADPKAWTGKNGIDSLAAFSENDYEQENIFTTGLFEKYQELATNGGIKQDDDVETVAGMVTTAYVTDSETARKFREGIPLEPRPIPGTTMIETAEDITNTATTWYQSAEAAAKTAADLQKSADTAARRKAALKEYKARTGLSRGELLSAFNRDVRSGAVTI